MPIVDTEGWKKCVDNNQDPYGGCCVNVAREVMRLLDERTGDFDPHSLICEADDNIKAGGITGFMAGAVASMVSKVHSRGEEFRQRWNGTYQKDGEPGRRPKDNGGVINPAIITIRDDA